MTPNSFEKVVKSNIDKFHISQELKDFFLSPRPAVIFGCGAQGRIAMDLCHMFHKKVHSFLVSDNGKRLCPYWLDFPFYKLSSFPQEYRDKVDVIVSISEENNQSVKNMLEGQGFIHIYLSENWTNANEILRKEWHDLYFKYHQDIEPGKLTFEKDSKGDTFLKIKVGKRFFKMFYPENPVERSNILGNFCELVIPPLFGDNQYVTEGPYEYGSVTLEEDDVVFDLGSNFGMFSSVALAKGCVAHAFEPTPVNFRMIERYLALAGGEFYVWPYAITEKKGEVSFNINDDFEKNLNSGNNSIMDRKICSSSITVPTISLDEFVREHSVQKVDFIKADIEGAERYMLMGARQVLKEFAPKLSLCTYHLRDDPQVMEQLILDANPNYVIEHKWSKLYAYCPER